MVIFQKIKLSEVPKITKSRRTLLEIIEDFKIPKLDENDDLESLKEVQEELDQIKEKIINLKNLIDYLVAKLYNLTNDDYEYIMDRM